MIDTIFGNTYNFTLLILSFAFMAIRSVHDGLSDRGFYQESIELDWVGWWPWHLINWAGRDLYLLGLYIHLYLDSCPWQTLGFSIVMLYLIHDFFYWWSFTHRHLFLWDWPWPKFLSLFKKFWENRQHAREKQRWADHRLHDYRQESQGHF